MKRGDRRALGVIASGLAVLLLTGLLVAGHAQGAEGRGGAPVGPRGQATSHWLAPARAAATAPPSALAASVPTRFTQSTTMPPRMRMGKRPGPGVLRAYFSCRAPALFLAPTLPPQCQHPHS